MKTNLSKPTITGIGIACATLLLTGSLIWIGRAVHAQRGPEPPPSGSSATDRIAAGRYFPERLLWVGTAAPTEGESQLLESLLNDCKGPGAYEAVGALEEFLIALPDSPWAASLRCNLGYYYRVRGPLYAGAGALAGGVGSYAALPVGSGPADCGLHSHPLESIAGQLGAS